MKAPVFVLTLFQDLATGLKKALAGDLETLLLELLTPPLQYEAQRLQQAMVVSQCFSLYILCWGFGVGVFMFIPVVPGFMFALVCLQGIGTDEDSLLEILCTRSGKQLKEISAAYEQGRSHRNVPPPER